MADKVRDMLLYIIDKYEGGYVNDPDDPGGATNMGITLETLRRNGIDVDGDGDIDVADIKLMSKEQALVIYEKEYVNRYYSLLPNPLCYKIIDIGINMGVKTAVTLFQRAVVALQPVGKIDVDGQFGINTLNAALKINADKLYNYFVYLVELRYKSLATNKPKLKKFLNGWLRRLSFKWSK